MPIQPVKTVKCGNGIVVKIYQDDDAEAPFQPDYIVKISCWHPRYDLGNNHDHETPQDFRDFCAAQEAEQHDSVVKLPVYLYDHSGLTVNTTGFSCPWDSGQVGYCWILTSEAQAHFSTSDRDEIEVILRSTVKILDNYLTGNVYGYVIENAKGEHLDSCWGFFGDLSVNADIMVEAMAEARRHADLEGKRLAEEAERRKLCYAI